MFTGMNRRQITLIVLLNALLSLVIALGVSFAIDARRPDPEELAALATAVPQPLMGGVTPVTSNTNAATLPTVAPLTANNPPAADTPAPADNLANRQQVIHEVQSGETLAVIAGKYGATLDEVIKLNQLTNPDVVYVGQQLAIPLPVGAAIPTPEAANGNGAPVTAAGGLQIRMVDSPGNLLSEALQIVNDGAQPLNLLGWRLERVDGPAYTFGDVPLFTGGSVWLHSVDGIDSSIALYWQQQQPVWSSGAVAHLVNPQGESVVIFTVP